MAFTLPSSPLGKFVGSHYKPALQQAAFRKLKSKGFAPPGTTASGTLTTSGARGGTARDRLLPPELIGVAGVRGAFAPGFTPRLNPNDYVVHTNDRGRTFWEPITEMTGLDPQSRATVRSYDAASAAQRPVIQSAYGDLQTSLNQNADAAQARLSSLGSLIQSQPLVAGAPQGVPDLQARLADTQRQQQTASSAVTVGQMSALPAIAATEGAKVLTGWDAARQKDREALFQGLRASEAEQAKQALQARQNDQSIAAQIRGQDLQLLGTQTTQAGGLQRALISSDTSLENTRANLENRLLIAELQGDVSTANNIRSTMAQLQSAAIRASASAKTGGNGRRAKDTAAFVKNVRKQLTGTLVRNPDYDPSLPNRAPQFVQKPGSVDPPGIIRDALAQGVAILPVLKAIRAVMGSGFSRSRSEAESLRNLLIEGGMQPNQATKIVKQFTGTTPTSTSSG